jgi:uncharacterized protein (TIGR02646 family)
MIPVIPQPEPRNFDADVRQPGKTWLRDHGISLNGPPPKGAALPTYWRNTQKDLWTAYEGVCAYLCIFFEWPLGAHSTDHFVAKSSNAGEAYEWANYRLSCLAMNRNKNKFDDVLDPFQIADNTFALNLSSGEISPSGTLSATQKREAAETITRLKLDSPECNEMRAQHYEEYLRQDVSADYLKKKSPFVWHEANRQSLL